MKQEKKESGFTLLEILVVITLILIIAGIAIPRFAGVTDEGRKAKATSELKTVQTALESYLLNTSSTVPGTASLTTANFLTLGTALEGATPRIIGKSSTMYDPFGATATTNYLFARSPNSKYYVAVSIGVNKTGTITGVSDTGDITGTIADDIYVTNGQAP